MLNELETIGSLLLLAATIPQFYKAWKNRAELRDISVTSYFGQSVACYILLVWALVNQFYFMAFLEVGFGVYATAMMILAIKKKRLQRGIKRIRRLIRMEV